MTLDELIKDLETAKDIAKENKNPNALVSATLAQAKLLGLDKGEKDEQEPITINIKRVGTNEKQNHLAKSD